MYKCIERVPKGDVKAEFTQQANLVRSCTVGNLNMVMATANDRTHLSCTGLSRPETILVQVLKEVKNDERLLFYYRAYTAK